jgi:hypothetical protein
LDKNIPVAVAATLIAALSAGASAVELSNVTVRVRAVHLAPADKSDAITVLGAPDDTICGSGV